MIMNERYNTFNERERTIKNEYNHHVFIIFTIIIVDSLHHDYY